jgi:hypothetical protein
MVAGPRGPPSLAGLGDVPWPALFRIIRDDEALRAALRQLLAELDGFPVGSGA